MHFGQCIFKTAVINLKAKSSSPNLTQASACLLTPTGKLPHDLILSGKCFLSKKILHLSLKGERRVDYARHSLVYTELVLARIFESYSKLKDRAQGTKQSVTSATHAISRVTHLWEVWHMSKDFPEFKHRCLVNKWHLFLWLNSYFTGTLT